MTKAVAPITGGISTPPVDAHASTAAEVERSKPVRCMAGSSVARGQHVGDDGAAHGAEQARGEDRDLRPPPRTWPMSAKAKLMKNRPHRCAAVRFRRSQTDDQLAERPHRNAERAFRGEGIVLGDVGDGVLRALKRAGHLLGDQRVEREHEDDVVSAAARRRLRSKEPKA